MDSIFQQVLRSSGHAGGINDHEIGPAGFSEALVRLAEKKCPGMPFHDRLEELLVKFILPNASRSDCDSFRQELTTSEILAVFKKHRVPLQRIFRFYATTVEEGGEPNSATAVIDLKGFVTLAKDVRILNANLSELNLKQIFTNIQHQDKDNGEEQDAEADFEVDYDEFLESIASLTEYVICNPYVPLYKRMDQFISDIFIPRAKHLKQNKRSERSRQTSEITASH